jgi:hypothetical protein
VPDGLATIAQEDFSAGEVRSVARSLIDPRGSYSVLNGLHDEDGSIYRRGGSQYKSNAAFGASLRWIWDGSFAAGQRTVFASPTAFGVLAADDATPVSLGGAGLVEPKSAALVGGILFIGGGTMYAGSRKTSDYSAGTVAVTNGSKTVAGTGTLWAANVDPGMLLRLAGRYYVVAFVNADTSITLTEAYEGTTASAQAYTLTRLGSAANHGAPVSDVYSTIGGRLVAGVGNAIQFSEGVNPGTAATGGAALVNNYRTWSWPAVNRQELAQGVQVIAAATVGSNLLVFTTGGVWSIGNMAFNIVDALGNPQQSVGLLSSDLVAWGTPGLAMWGNAVIVAATDGVYLVDGVSTPQPLSRSKRPDIEAHVRLGRKPGAPAVYKHHLFLPVLDASNNAVDMMVCRLDRPVGTREGTVFPWSHFDGHGGNVTALAVRMTPGAQRLPDLLGASRSADARVLGLGGYFEPSAAVKNDANGTTHWFTLETRDFTAGAPRTPGLVRMVAVRYELMDAAADAPVLTLWHSGGTQNAGLPLWNEVTWNDFQWPDPATAEFRQALGAAPTSDGRLPYVWRLERHTAFVRGRIVCTRPAAKLVVRSIEWHIRQSARP